MYTLLLNHNVARLIICTSAALLSIISSLSADEPIRQRRLFTEYGKVPSRFVELEHQGKLVLEFQPPSITVILAMQQNGSILFGYGGKSTNPVPLFDGKSFAGWEGDIKSVWRIEDGALVAGSLQKKQANNNFLATTKEFTNFELSLKWKLEGTEGFINGGVQFRSKRIPNDFEVIGYQADLGAGFDGALYDESRRKKVLMKPTPEVLTKAAKPLGEWNDYRIRAEGKRIQLWLNGVQTVDYTETEAGIEETGLIAVQIHGNATSIVRYKDIVIEELK